MACHLYGDKPLSKQMMTSHRSITPKETVPMKKLSKLERISFEEEIIRNFAGILSQERWQT